MAPQTKAYLSVVFICIVWGTTYLAIKVGVQYYPAFLFAGVRQTIAGIVLMVVAYLFNKKTDFSIKNTLRQMLVGFLMLSLGNGCVTWGEKYIPSGIAALICSMMPLFAVLFNLFGSKKEHFNSTIGIGMLLGTCGVGLVFLNDIKELSNISYLWGILAVLFATASWAFGSIINKKNTNPVNPFLNSGMQLFFGGIFMLIASPAIDDYKNLVIWNTNGLLALAYLIVFGSITAYAAYMYALRILPVGIATIYAYINPMVAVLLGYFAMQEPMNLFTILAFGTIVISVYLVNKGYRKQHKTENLNTENINEEAFPENIPIES